jgi:hypothetical protein
MIELMLSLAILVMLTGFLAGGLSMARRAFDSDRVGGIASQTVAVINVMSDLIGSALPTQGIATDQSARAAFNGRRDALSFVGLSEGRSLSGGPHRISLQQIGSDVVVDVTNSVIGTKEAAGEHFPLNIVVLTGVRKINFAYFGAANTTAVPGWRAQWIDPDHLPDLVSIRVFFEDERRDEPAVIVALHQK